MRIEIPISPDEPIGYYPKDIHLSLTIEDARKLAAIRSGLRDANCKHSGNCDINSVEDALTCLIQHAVAEDTPRADEPEAVVEDAPS